MSKYASAALRTLQKFIVDQGEIVSVYRASTKTTQKSYAQCQPLPVTQAAAYSPQGSDNIGNAQPHLFVFPAACDVREQDLITFNGKNYRVVSAVMSRLEGVNLNLECIGVRE